MEVKHVKIDRLIGIVTILLQKGRSTAPELAERFEVSRRTIMRDIDDLCRAGIPIAAAQGRNGGISIMEGYAIDRTLLTNRELQAIFVGLRSLDSVSGGSQYQQLMEKLSAKNSAVLAETEHILIDLSSWYKSSLAPKIQLIQDAIELKHLISFDYFAPHGDSARTLEPYLLVFQWGAWYVWGYCRLREDFRMFKLNRLTNLTMLQDVFEPRETPRFEPSPNYLNGQTIPVKAIVEPALKWRLIEGYGLDCFTQLQEGRLLFSFEFFDRANILEWIFSFGDQIELLEPRELRGEIRRQAEKIAEKYRKQDI